MRTNRWNLALGLGLILAAALACNFNVSTANISSIKIGKDDKATTETATFGPNDKIFIIATLSNTSDKWKMKCRLYVDDVAGQKSGELVPGSEIEKELPSAGTMTFTYTGALPNGKYKAEVSMINDKGEEKDKKSGTFTVAGSSAGSSSSSSNSNMSNMNMSSDNENQ
jgi:hypothetical protein